MKTITVDFTKDNIGTIAREGELNRTQLVFALDEDLQMCDFINVKFGTNENLEDDECPVLEYLHPDEGGTTLTIKLNQDMTVRGVLYMQLDGYAIDSETSEPHMIAKSPVVSGVIIPSIKGVKKILEGNPSLLDRILTKVHTLLEKAHVHENFKTLKLLACVAADMGAADGPAILPQYEGVDRPTFWGNYLSYCSDGAVITGVFEREDESGNKFLRIYISLGPVPQFAPHLIPDYIDIPVSGIKKVTEQSGPELTLNGNELVLPGGSSDDTATSMPTLTATDDGNGNVKLSFTTTEVTE